MPNDLFEGEQVEPSVRKFTIDNLEPATKYEIKVAAYSRKEMGDFAILRQFSSPVDENGKINVN